MARVCVCESGGLKAFAAADLEAANGRVPVTHGAVKRLLIRGSSSFVWFNV